MTEQLTVRKPDIFHIRINGHVDAQEARQFDGFAIAARDGGDTLLSGWVADQAALFGILHKIQDLGLPLQLVAQIACPCANRDCPRHGNCQECYINHSDKEKPCYCFREGTEWDGHYAGLAQAR
jgi:hypothetical protein